jgi:hypothetical protein
MMNSHSTARPSRHIKIVMDAERGRAVVSIRDAQPAPRAGKMQKSRSRK